MPAVEPGAGATGGFCGGRVSTRTDVGLARRPEATAATTSSSGGDGWRSGGLGVRGLLALAVTPGCFVSPS